MTRTNPEVGVEIRTDLFSYLVGGCHYHLRRPIGLTLVFYETGVHPNLDEVLERMVSRIGGVDVVHINVVTSVFHRPRFRDANT